MTSGPNNSDVHGTLKDGQAALERGVQRYRDLFQFVPVPVLRIDRPRWLKFLNSRRPTVWTIWSSTRRLIPSFSSSL